MEQQDRRDENAADVEGKVECGGDETWLVVVKGFRSQVARSPQVAATLSNTRMARRGKSHVSTAQYCGPAQRLQSVLGLGAGNRSGSFAKPEERMAPAKARLSLSGQAWHE